MTNIHITIPVGLDFSDLKLAWDPMSGDVLLDQAPIERILEANGVNVTSFGGVSEDDIANVLTAWYREHLRLGGAPDPVEQDLIAQIVAEDNFGGGLSYPPGRA